MKALIAFYRTTVGKKVVMAITGLILVLFVIGHMLGNLKAFGGYDATGGVYKIDAYAVFLREFGADLLGHSTFLWLTRAVLLLAVILHVMAAVQLWSLNNRARPEGYASGQRYGSATPASRSMRYGGLFLVFFIIYHILHFTTGTVHPAFEEGHVYGNLMSAFSAWYLVLFYVLAMGALMLHLYHGVWSMLQTLGLLRPEWNGIALNTARVIAVALFIGFSAVPIGAFIGALPAPHYVTAHAEGD